MKRKAFLLLALFLAALCGRSEAGSLLDLDHASFRAGDTLGFVEVYSSVQRSGLIYTARADTMTAGFRIVLDVTQNGKSVLADTFAAQDVRDTSEQQSAAGQFFVHVFRFVMRPGHYGLRAALYQQEPEPRDNASDSVIVGALSDTSLHLSDIELGSHIEFTKETSPLVKNGVRLIPNPTGFFGTELPLMYYYAEAYGMDFDSARVDSYTVVRRVLDAESGQAVRPDVPKNYPTRGRSVVIADGFPISTLRTGTYYLELEVQNSRTGRVISARKKFWTYRRADLQAGKLLERQPAAAGQSAPAPVAGNILAALDPDSVVQWMRYLMTKDELKQTQRLTDEGKQRFVNEYWQTQDANNPGASDRYFARVFEANRRYTFLKRPGWKTDRGRVYILYGEPDHVTQNYAVAGQADNEIWDYDQLDGGSTFVFLDRNGFGDLDLVHSTKRGEIYNPNWNNTSSVSGQRR